MEKQNNTSFNYTDSSGQYDLIIDVVEIMIICIGLPLVLVAICAVYFLAKKDHSVPLYIINLLISDLIQLCCLAAFKAKQSDEFVENSYTFSLVASVGFMVCISLERYLVIAKPLWYRFRRNIKTSLVVCAAVWTLALVCVLLLSSDLQDQVKKNICVVIFSLPLPVYIFFLIGSIKALSSARTVTAEEKRRVLAILVAVLLIHALLFFPNVVWSLLAEVRHDQTFLYVASILLFLSPLADVMLYFCIRRSALDNLLKMLCLCKMRGNQEMSSTSVQIISAPSSEIV